MSGYLAQCVDGVHKSGLSCLHCKLFLRNPVQTDEGQRLCRACFQEIRSLVGGLCTECDVIITSDNFYPDKAVQREVFALLVRCEHHLLGCEWQGALKNWEAHSANCSFKGITCPNEGCGQIFTVTGLDLHKGGCSFRLISCNYCSNKFPVNQKNVHESVCDEIPITCAEQICSAMFPRKMLSQHKEKECLIQSCLTCQVKVVRGSGEELTILSTKLPTSQPSNIAKFRGIGIDRTTSCPVSANMDYSFSTPPISPKVNQSERVHLASPIQNFQHHQQLAYLLRGLEAEVVLTKNEQAEVATEWVAVKAVVAELREEKSLLQTELCSIKTELLDIRNMMKDLKGQLSFSPDHRDTERVVVQVKQLMKADSEKDHALQLLQTKLKDVKKELEETQWANHGGLGMGQFGVMGKVERDTATIMKKGGAMDGYRGHSALDSGYDSKVKLHHVEELNQQMNKLRVHMSDLELQLQSSLASTYTGAFLWRIPDVTRRRRDALEGRVTSIYSPPFYTGRNGYKMCIRGYLNGDGMGYQSHLSIFFVIMRGECDPLLKWPFEHKVSMILVDQTHRKHIVQTFKPTAESNSFQQPKLDMNVASGCPQFAKLSIFDDPCYVKDDIMFVKCIVDTSKIFHP